jgi:hypothetical protein
MNMTTTTELLLRTALVGALATAILDAWTLLLRTFKVPTLDMALVGRWMLHGFRGTWTHERIASAASMRGEAAAGWIVHYATGVAFAALLVGVASTSWLLAPTPWPAVAVGAATVAAPWLVMQPAMGAGFASSRTPTPTRNRVRSLANHTVFGAGMYLAAACIAWISR